MKTCPNCMTTGIPDSANFCPVCGQQLKSGKIELIHIPQTLEKKKSNAISNIMTSLQYPMRRVFLTLTTWYLN